MPLQLECSSAREMLSLLLNNPCKTLKQGRVFMTIAFADDLLFTGTSSSLQIMPHALLYSDRSVSPGTIALRTEWDRCGRVIELAVEGARGCDVRGVSFLSFCTRCRKKP